MNAVGVNTGKRAIVSFPEKQAVVNGGLRDNLIMKAFKGMYGISC